LKNQSVKEIYRARREWVNNYKTEHGCALCPEKNPAALDFHHKKKSEKAFTVSQAIHSKSIDQLEAEIKRCVVLCARCHRLVESGVLTLPESVEQISQSGIAVWGQERLWPCALCAVVRPLRIYCGSLCLTCLNEFPSIHRSTHPKRENGFCDRCGQKDTIEFVATFLCQPCGAHFL
jgi:hypothetical protein